MHAFITRAAAPVGDCHATAGRKKKQPNVFDGGGSEYISDQSRNSQLAWIQVGLFIARGTYAKTKIPHRTTKEASYNGCFTRIRAIFQDAQGKVWRAA
jgi:hypothetical protein